MTDLEIYRPHGELTLTASTAMERAADFTTWAPKLQSAAAIAREVCQTDFVPAALRGKPAAVAAAIMAGSEMNLGPMASLMHVHIIDGRPSLSSEMQRALVLSLGHKIRYRETTATRCVVDGQRNGEAEWTTVQWTMDDAKRASLDGRQNWRKFPRRMLVARATGELCRMLFADALAGMPYSAEELEDEADDAPAVTDDAPAAEPAKPRTARRRARTETASPAHAVPPSAPAPPPVPQGAGEASLPPLPGEEDAAPAVPDETAPSGPAAGADPTTSGASSSARVPDSGSRRRTGERSPSSSTTSEPDDTDYDTPGTVTPQQLTRIWATLAGDFGFGHDEKDQARTVCAHITGHDLASSKDLSHNEAKAVIDTLSHWKAQAEGKGEHPHDYLIAVMVAEEAASGE